MLLHFYSLAIIIAFNYQHLDACQTLKHEQCIGNSSLCFQRHCIAGEPLTSVTSCKNDFQCRKDVMPLWRRLSIACKAGRCIRLKAIGPEQCLEQKKCPGQSICIRQVCVAAEPCEYTCRIGKICGLGERCIGGLCFRPVPS
ncbi:hypothetical protein M514_00699 [Trichuris suis]|uniref:DUF7107 domain-containing protein n=1 Tax=Trichuris suis TaxID=68888 RepID=A0A085N6K6_9BILA|nr:hypothetical protein M513_00699 [Trichuris suis]KFD65102.1 hypothetical protein M514_00699 [Trichuris suis]